MVGVVVSVAAPACLSAEPPVFRAAGAPQSPPPQGVLPKKGQARFQPAPGDALPNLPEVFFLDTNGRQHAEDAAKWTATIDIVGEIGCTATAIGPRVLLTAAHCLQGYREFSFTANIRDTLTATCEPHPRFQLQGAFRLLDYALCYLSRDYPRTIVLVDTREIPILFERISLDPRHATPLRGDARSARLLMSGYGCIGSELTEPDGILRAGIGLVSAVAPIRLTVGSAFRRGSGVLCAGDSGGAAYRYFTDNPYGHRVIVAINSSNVFTRNISYLSKTSSPAFIQFFKAWRSRWGDPKVCGIDREVEAFCHE